MTSRVTIFCLFLLCTTGFSQTGFSQTPTQPPAAAPATTPFPTYLTDPTALEMDLKSYKMPGNRLTFISRSLGLFLIHNKNPNSQLSPADKLLEVQRADCAAAPTFCVNPELLQTLCKELTEKDFLVGEQIWNNFLQTVKTEEEAMSFQKTIKTCSTTPTLAQFLGYSLLLFNATKTGWLNAEVSIIKDMINTWNTPPQNFLSYWRLINESIVRLSFKPKPLRALKYMINLSLIWNSEKNYPLIPKKALNEWAILASDLFSLIGSTPLWEQFLVSHPDLTDGKNAEMSLTLTRPLCVQWRENGKLAKCIEKLTALKSVPEVTQHPNILPQIIVEEAFNDRASGNLKAFEDKIKTLIQQQSKNKGFLPWLYANLAVAKIDLHSPKEAHALIKKSSLLAKQAYADTAFIQLFLDRLTVSALQEEGKNQEAINLANKLKSQFSQNFSGPNIPQVFLVYTQLLAAINAKNTQAVDRYDKELQFMLQRVPTLAHIQHLSSALIKAFRKESATEALDAAQKLLGEPNPEFQRAKAIVVRLQKENPPPQKAI